MKKYFIYELKKNAFIIGFLTLCAVVAYTFPLILAEASSLASSVNLTVISVIGGVIALCASMKIFEYKTKKRSVDLFYALPLSHTHILIVKYLVGLLIIFIPYTVAYWLGSFIVMAKVFRDINAVWYIPQFFGSIIPIYIIYAISSFAFTRANKSQDGGMFVIFWFFALPFATFLICELLNTESYATAMFMYNPLLELTKFSMEKISAAYYLQPFSNLSRNATGETAAMIVGFVINSLLAIGSTAGIILLEKRAKAENVSQISDSWFGYKVMLPFYTVCILGICTLPYDFSIFGIVLLAIVMFALTILYRRTAKIGKKQAIIFVVSVLAGIILALINSFV